VAEYGNFYDLDAGAHPGFLFGAGLEHFPIFFTHK
jgi:hypothetical protein